MIIAGENAFASKIKIHVLKALEIDDALVRRIIPAHFFAFTSSLDIERRFFRGRESSRSRSGGS
jgi:hypothetical protein